MDDQKTRLKLHPVLEREIWEAAVTEYPSHDNAVDLFLRDCYNSYYELQVLMRDYDVLRRECFNLHDKIHKLVSKLITDETDGTGSKLITDEEDAV